MSNSQKVLASDIMTEHVITTHPDAAVKDIVHLMLRNRIGGMPVVNDEGNLCGVITSTDLLRVLGDLMINQTFGDYNKLFKDRIVKVSEVMTKDVVSIKAESLIDDVIKLSVYKGIHTFPVMENGKVVGILGKRDILNAGFSLIS
jgi:CBS domain-containing protein